MQLFLNALIAGSLAALIAGGLALVYGVLGVFNLALGQTVLLGGYFTWQLQAVGVPLPLSILGGIGGGALLSWLIFKLFVAPFYKHHRFLPLVTTIACSMILDGLMLLMFEERARRIATTPVYLEFANARISLMQLALIVIALLLLLACAYLLHLTPLGRRIRAVVQHDSAALSLGIPAPALHRWLFVASGVLAAAGGVFLGIDQNLTPTLAFPITIKAYAAIIAGGQGNLWGAVLCAYLIALLEQLAVGVHWFGVFYIPAGYQISVSLLLIIGFLLWKPSGMFGSTSRAT